MSNVSINETEGGTQATQVGSEFKPGAEGSAEIERLLGFPAQVMAGKSHRRIAEDPAGLQWLESLDYCEDDALTIEMLENRGVSIFIMETVEEKPKRKGKPKEFVQEYVGLFETAGELCVTVPFEREAHVAACALWYVLSK